MIKNTKIKKKKKAQKEKKKKKKKYYISMIKNTKIKKKKKRNLKMTASMKVKAGVRLLTAEARVGELYSIPIYSDNRARNLPSVPT